MFRRASAGRQEPAVTAERSAASRCQRDLSWWVPEHRTRICEECQAPGYLHLSREFTAALLVPAEEW